MSRSYSGFTKINTEDALEALKHTMNYEGDLYYNGQLVYSCMGLDYEDNKENLSRFGIIPLEDETYIKWQYADQSKNVKKYFVDFLEYKNTYTGKGEDSLQVNLHDYKQYKDSIEFKSLEAIYSYILDNYINKIEESAINVVDFTEDCKSYKFNEFMELVLNLV
jgi:hypothetical protein